MTTTKIEVALCQICRRELSRIKVRGEQWRHNQSSVLDHEAIPNLSTIRDLMQARS